MRHEIEYVMCRRFWLHEASKLISYQCRCVAHAVKSLHLYDIEMKVISIIASFSVCDYYVESQQLAQMANDIMTQQFSGIHDVSSAKISFSVCMLVQQTVRGFAVRRHFFKHAIFLSEEDDD